MFFLNLGQILAAQLQNPKLNHISKYNDQNKAGFCPVNGSPAIVVSLLWGCICRCPDFLPGQGCYRYVSDAQRQIVIQCSLLHEILNWRLHEQPRMVENSELERLHGQPRMDENCFKKLVHALISYWPIQSSSCKLNMQIREKKKI